MAKNSQPNGPKKTPRTRKDAVAAGRKNSEAYREKLNAYLAKRKLTKQDKKKFEAILGKRPYKGSLRASDVEAKDELRKQLIFHVDAWQRQNPTFRFFFITLFAEECDVSKKEPILWLRRLKRKADKSIRELNVEGAVGMIESCFIPCPPDKQKPVYSFHVHILAWARQEFDLTEARQTLAASGSWSNGWGIPPTDIHEITPEKGVAAWWAYYMMKHPIDAKNVMEVGGKLSLRSTKKGYRGDAALRLLEGFAQCDLADMFFGVKDGKFIRDPVWRNTKKARKLANPDLKPVSLDRIATVFKRFWKRSRAEHGKPWRIIS